jgi:cytochrome c-type biogenesis protein
MSSLNLLTAFVFGFLAFLSPCTFPLIPSFISFLAGVSVKNLEDEIFSKQHRNTILLHVGAYVLGSCLTLVVLGATAGELGYFIKSERYLLQQIGGVIVILFGLYIGGFLQTSFLSRGFQLSKITKVLELLPSRYAYIVSFLIGVVFTLGWIPCISPILGAILILAASSHNALSGGFLLFVYALGQNVPLVLVSILLSSYIGYFTYVRKHIVIFQRVCGVFLIVLGMFLILGSFSVVTQFFYALANNFGF